MCDYPVRYTFDYEFKKVFVKDLINTKKMKYYDFIATEQGLSNIIKSTTVMDVKDIDVWIHEGDVLIISRFMTTCFTDEFIHMIHRKKVACVITQKKFKKYVTKENENLLLSCHIPLVFVDDQMSWSDVIVTIQNLIIHNQTQYLIENQKFQTSVIKYLSNQYSLNSLCEIVYNLTGISIAIADYNLRVVDTSKDNDWKNELMNLTKPALVNYVSIGEGFDESSMMGYQYKDKTSECGFQYFVIPSHLSKFTANFYIIIKCEDDISYLSSQVISRVETIESIYSLKSSIMYDLNKSNYYFKSVIFEGLLEMNYDDEVKKKQISLSLNTDLKSNYYLILVKNAKNNKICKNVDLLTGFIDYLKHTGFYNETILIFLYKNKWVFLVDDSVKSVRETGNTLYHSLMTYFNNEQFTLGISNICCYWNLKQAHKEANFAINYLENNNENSILMYNELGIIKLFSDGRGNINNVYIEELFQNYLKPILTYDKKHSTELFNTLVILFSNEMSYKSTSENLFIHVNTLRARINKIEELLTIDLKHLDSIMNLRLVTLLYQFDYFTDEIKLLNESCIYVDNSCNVRLPQ